MVKRLIGGILIAAGIPIAGATGLCTSNVLGGHTQGENYGVFSLIVGGISFCLGLGLIFVGTAMIRKAGRL
jgi:hypothetical protein